MSESDILLRDIAATCKRLLMHLATGSSDCMSDLSVEMDIELLVQRSQALLDHYGSQVHTISHFEPLIESLKNLQKFSKSKDGMTDSSECTRMASRLLYSINVIEASTSGSRTRTPSPRKMGSAGMMMNQQPVSRDDSYATLMQDDQKEDLMTTGLGRSSQTLQLKNPNEYDHSHTPERQRFCTECDCANVKSDVSQIKRMLSTLLRKPRGRTRVRVCHRSKKLEEADIASAQSGDKEKLRNYAKITQSLTHKLQDFHATLVDKQSNMSKRLETAVESLNWLKNQGSGTCRPNAPARSQYDTHIASLHDRLKALELVLDDLRCDGQKRRLAPSKDYLNAVILESSEIESLIHSVAKDLETKKPIWKKKWEEQLNEIVKEQGFLKKLEEDVSNMDLGHKSLTQTLIEIIKGIQECGIDEKGGNGFLLPLVGLDEDEKQRELAMEIQRRIFENPDDFDSTSRMAALQRTERLREWKNAHREHELQYQLKSYIGGGALRQVGVGDVEKKRQEAFKQLVGKSTGGAFTGDR